jgi:hypothetical protein
MIPNTSDVMFSVNAGSALHRHPSPAKVMTWSCNQKILDLLITVLSRFSNAEINYDLMYFSSATVSWRFGAEIDFDLRVDNSRFNAEFLSQKRQEIIAIIRSEEGSHKTKNQVIKEIEEVSQFNIKEIILFEIYKNLEPIVEYRFGKQNHQIGYYDNETPEIRTRVFEALDFIESYHLVLEEIIKRARYYQVEVVIPSSHISVSPWLKDGDVFINLAEINNAESIEFMRRCLMGIRQVFDDGILLLEEAHTLGRYSNEKPISVHPSRGYFIRPCRDRIEIRSAGGLETHIANRMLMIIKGAEFALTSNEEHLSTCNIINANLVTGFRFETQKILSESPENPWGELFFTSRILQGCIVASGKTNIPLDYIWEEAAYYCYTELFDVEPRMTLPYQQSIVDVFSQIEILPGGLNLTYLRKWWNDEAPYKFAGYMTLPDKRFESLKKKLEQIKLIASFKTFICNGPRINLGSKYLPENAQRLSHSFILKFIYGNDFLLDILSICLEKQRELRGCKEQDGPRISFVRCGHLSTQYNVQEYGARDDNELEALVMAL